MKQSIHHTLAIMSLLVAAPLAHASQEGILELGAFQATSPGIGKSGPVVVSGERKGQNVSSLCVQAFERTSCLAPAQLAILSSRMINGIQISYEAGYSQTGGRTVYVLLSKGFTGSRLEANVVSVAENGEIRVKSAAGQ
jgi:hypothetical protein